MKVKVCLFTVLILLCSCSQFADYSDYDPDNIAHVYNGEGMDLTKFGKGTLYCGGPEEGEKGILNSTWTSYHEGISDEIVQTYWFCDYKFFLQFGEEEAKAMYGGRGINSSSICLYSNGIDGKAYVGKFQLKKKKGDYFIYISILKEQISTIPSPLPKEDKKLDIVSLLEKYPVKYVDVEPFNQTFKYLINEENLVLY